MGSYGASFSALSRDGSAIIGSSRTSSGHDHGFHWQNGVLTDLGTLGGNSSTALRISDNGAVVGGIASNASGDFVAFRWENGSMTALHDTSSSFIDMTNDGNVILITGEDADRNIQTYRWENGNSENIGTLGGTSTFASDLSADGKVIVGGGLDNASNYLYYRWSQDDGIKSLKDILTDAGVDISGWDLSGNQIFVNEDGSIITGTGNFNGDNKVFIMTMNGLTTPQEFQAALTSAIDVPNQAMSVCKLSPINH